MKKIVLGSFSLLVLAFILCTSQTGCIKDDTTKIDTVQCTPTIEGVWIGNQLNGSGDGQAFSWSIRPDGTASYENTIFGIRQLCVGTWTLTNGTLKCNVICVYGVPAFIGAAQTYTAKYNATTGALTNGTYETTTPSLADSGTFTLTEVNANIDTVNQCTPSIQGLWIGAQINTSGDGQAFSWSIRPDGTASYENTIFGIRQLCVGTWTLTNGTWTCNVICVYGVPAFVGAAQTYTAKYNATTGTLTNGTYQTTTPGLQDTGTFTAVEVN